MVLELPVAESTHAPETSLEVRRRYPELTGVGGEEEGKKKKQPIEICVEF